MTTIYSIIPVRFEEALNQRLSMGKRKMINAQGGYNFEDHKKKRI